MPRPTTRSSSLDPVEKPHHQTTSASDFSNLPPLEQIGLEHFSSKISPERDDYKKQSIKREITDVKQSLTMAELTDNLLPETFKGESREDPELWWSAIESWLRLRQLSGDAAVAAVSLLFRDNARRWFNSLADDQKDDISTLHDAFLERYVSKATAWQDRVALFDCRQIKNQTVEEYLQQMETKAARAQASKEQIVAAMINGLLPDIRQQVLHHEPKNNCRCSKMEYRGREGSKSTR